MQQSVNKFFDYIAGKRVAFCGVGRTNLPLIKMFSQKGALVTACDSKREDQLADVIKQLEPYNIQFMLGPEYLQNLDFDIIFRSPGLKFSTPELVEARQRGSIVTSEMEVFF